MDKLDFTKPDELQTRDGRAVRIYATDGLGIYFVHGAIKNNKGWIQDRWDDEGANYRSYGANDLVRKPAHVTGWVNVYEQFGCLAPQFGDVAYATQQLAKENISSKGKCFGQIYIDVEVQQ